LSGGKTKVQWRSADHPETIDTAKGLPSGAAVWAYCWPAFLRIQGHWKRAQEKRPTGGWAFE